MGELFIVFLGVEVFVVYLGDLVEDRGVALQKLSLAEVFFQGGQVALGVPIDQLGGLFGRSCFIGFNSVLDETEPLRDVSDRGDENRVQEFRTKGYERPDPLTRGTSASTRAWLF